MTRSNPLIKKLTLKDLQRQLNDFKLETNQTLYNLKQENEDLKREIESLKSKLNLQASDNEELRRNVAYYRREIESKSVRARAERDGIKNVRGAGRKGLSQTQIDKIKAMLDKGFSVADIVKETGIKRATVYRYKNLFSKGVTVFKDPFDLI